MEYKNKKNYQRTIPEELLAEWQAARRKNDSEDIAAIVGVSKVTIDKALTHGSVHQDKIRDGINKFFADRMEKELADAARLRSLREATEV